MRACVAPSEPVSKPCVGDGTDRRARQSPEKKKILKTILHKRAFSKLAAVAIIQIDIPMPLTQIAFNGNDPWQEEMTVKLQYAQETGRWLTCFAQIATAYRNQERYQRDLASTPQRQLAVESNARNNSQT